MLIEFEFQGDVCILRLKGRFATGGDAQYLRGKVDEMKATGYRKVLADFRNVPYIDSTGIGFVVGAFTSLKNSGGQFVLASVNANVLSVLEITKLATIIPVYPDEKCGIEAMAARSEAKAPKQSSART